jgi:hypothetical protein
MSKTSQTLPCPERAIFISHPHQQLAACHLHEGHGNLQRVIFISHLQRDSLNFVEGFTWLLALHGKISGRCTPFHHAIVIALLGCGCGRVGDWRGSLSDWRQLERVFRFDFTSELTSNSQVDFTVDVFQFTAISKRILVDQTFASKPIYP